MEKDDFSFQKPACIPQWLCCQLHRVILDYRQTILDLLITMSLNWELLMPQGLIQWQGLAFKKGPDVLNIKREAEVLRPYNSASEINFHRGAGITLQKKSL